MDRRRIGLYLPALLLLSPGCGKSSLTLHPGLDAANPGGPDRPESIADLRGSEGRLDIRVDEPLDSLRSVDAGADAPISPDLRSHADLAPDTADAEVDAPVTPDLPLQADLTSDIADTEADAPVSPDLPLQADLGLDALSEDADTAPADAPQVFRTASCDDMVDWSQSITDWSIRGSAACAGTTVGDILATIRREHPEVADLKPDQGMGSDAGLYCLFDGTSWNCECALETLCVSPTDVKVVHYGDGFRVFMKHLSGTTGMLDYRNMEYWYFETNPSCHPDMVGHYEHSSGMLSCEGSMLWGAPWAGYYQNCAPFSEGKCPGGDADVRS